MCAAWDNWYVFHQGFEFAKEKVEPFDIVPGKIIDKFNTVFYVWFLCCALWTHYYVLTRYIQISITKYQLPKLQELHSNSTTYFPCQKNPKRVKTQAA